MTAAYWHNGNFFGVQIIYAPNAKAWRHIMVTYAPENMANAPFPASDGHCCTFRNRKDLNEQISVVTVGTGCAARVDLAQMVAILAHEAVHVWRHVREKIGETDPSSEFEAYAVQSIVQFLVSTHMKSHRTPWRKA